MRVFGEVRKADGWWTYTGTDHGFATRAEAERALALDRSLANPGSSLNAALTRLDERAPIASRPEECICDPAHGMKPGCPVHGRKAIAFHPASTINGIEDEAMESCQACMDDGATPLGAWSRIVPCPPKETAGDADRRRSGWPKCPSEKKEAPHV